MLNNKPKIRRPMEKLKILITTPSFPPLNSGLGNAVYRQVTMLSSFGFNVVIATGGEARLTRVERELGVCIEEFNVSGSDSLINPLKGNIESYKDFLMRSDFDLILMNAWQTWSTDICLRHIGDISGKKVIYSHCISTNVFFVDQPAKSLARYLLWRPYFLKVRANLKKLDALICLASEGEDSRFDDVEIAKNVGLPIHIVPNVLSEDALKYIDLPPESIEYRNQIISVGSYDWNKGHDFVLRAYALSSAKNLIPLKIYGQKFTSFTEKLRMQALKLGIKNQFLEFHEGISGSDLLHEYRKSIAFLYGSRTECQPLVILDAMASGTPFVSRGTGCICTLRGGYSVDSEFRAAKCLDKVIECKEEWYTLSVDGVEAAKANYQTEIVGQKLVTVIHNICNDIYDF